MKIIRLSSLFECVFLLLGLGAKSEANHNYLRGLSLQNNCLTKLDQVGQPCNYNVMNKDCGFDFRLVPQLVEETDGNQRCTMACLPRFRMQCTEKGVFDLVAQDRPAALVCDDWSEGISAVQKGKFCNPEP